MPHPVGVLSGSGVRPGSVQWTSWVRQPKRKAYHAPLSIITVKNAWNNTDSSSCGFKAWDVLSSCKYIEHKFSRSTNTRVSIKQLQGFLGLMWNLYILLVLNSSTYIQGVPGGMDKTSGECPLC